MNDQQIFDRASVIAYFRKCMKELTPFPQVIAGFKERFGDDPRAQEVARQFLANLQRKFGR